MNIFKGHYIEKKNLSKKMKVENAQKIGAAGDSNPGPLCGFVVFRAALLIARTDGKTLTWVGKEGIHSETVKFVKKIVRP